MILVMKKIYKFDKGSSDEIIKIWFYLKNINLAKIKNLANGKKIKIPLSTKI